VNAIFIGLMLEGKRPRIFGDGNAVRDYLYVGDVVEANVRALEKASGEMLNLGTGIGTSVNDIVRELKAILGFSEDAIYEAHRPGEIQRIYLDASKAKRVLGWEPQVAFADGLRRTVEWTRQNPLPTKH
jgi:UDP-glucose 4-epimerase